MAAQYLKGSRSHLQPAINVLNLGMNEECKECNVLFDDIHEFSKL